MEQVNPAVIQSQGIPSATLAKEKAKLAALKRKAKPAALKKKRVKRGDNVVQSKTPLPALTGKEQGVVVDPLAGQAPNGQQQDGGGAYYPPVGMPGIYFAMKAMMLDLRAGNAIAQIDNNLMKSEFKQWVKQFNHFAEQSRKFYKQQAQEALWTGCTQLVSAAGNAVSLVGSGWFTYKGEQEITSLTKQKAELEAQRPGSSAKIEKDDLAAASTVRHIEGEGGEALPLVDRSAEISVSSAASSAADTPSAVVDTPAGEPAPTTPAGEPASRTPAGEPAKEDDLGIRKQQVRDKRIRNENERLQKVNGATDEKRKAINLEYKNRDKLVEDELNDIKDKDKGLESQIKEIDRKLAKAGQDSRNKVEMLQNVGYMAAALGKFAEGLANNTIGLSKAKADYLRNTADLAKQVAQTLTQAYAGQVDRDYQAIDQELSSLESAMRALYAAQTAGAA